MLFVLFTPIAYIAIFVFLVFCCSTTLLYVSDRVEENTGATRKVINYLINTTMAAFVLLWLFDELPFLPVLFSIACNYVFKINMKNFPFLSLNSTLFYLSCALAFANHIQWFYHYHGVLSTSSSSRSSYNSRSSNSGALSNLLGLSGTIYDLQHAIVFFVFLVWLVPFAMVITMSASDLVIKYGDSSEQKRNAVLQNQFAPAKPLISVLLAKLLRKPALPTTSEDDTASNQAQSHHQQHQHQHQHQQQQQQQQQQHQQQQQQQAAYMNTSNPYGARPPSAQSMSSVSSVSSFSSSSASAFAGAGPNLAGARAVSAGQRYSNLY